MPENATPRPAAELLISVREAAGRLSISERSMWRLVELGEVGSVTVHRLRRIPAAALVDYIERRVEAATPVGT